MAELRLSLQMELVIYSLTLCLAPLLNTEPLLSLKMLPASAQPVKGIWIRDPALLLKEEMRPREGSWQQIQCRTCPGIPAEPCCPVKEKLVGKVWAWPATEVWCSSNKESGGKVKNLNTCYSIIEEETRAIHRHTSEKMRNPQVNTLQGTWRELTNTWSEYHWSAVQRKKGTLKDYLHVWAISGPNSLFKHWEGGWWDRVTEKAR